VVRISSSEALPSKGPAPDADPPGRRPRSTPFPLAERESRHAPALPNRDPLRRKLKRREAAWRATRSREMDEISTPHQNAKTSPQSVPQHSANRTSISVVDCRPRSWPCAERNASALLRPSSWSNETNSHSAFSFDEEPNSARASVMIRCVRISAQRAPSPCPGFATWRNNAISTRFRRQDCSSHQGPALPRLRRLVDRNAEREQSARRHPIRHFVAPLGRKKLSA
jgi:hypothetical protein